MNVIILDMLQPDAEVEWLKEKGAYIISIPGIEEDRISVKKMWHNSVSRHNRPRGS